MSVSGLVILGSLILSAVLAGLLLLSPGSSNAPASGPLVVHCAAAIKGPAEAAAREYEREFGIPVQFNFGGSQTLLAGIEVSQHGDLFIPADESYIVQARRKGIVAESIPLAQMSAVIAVRKGNPKRILSLQDLLHPDVRLAQASPGAAAIGTLVREALLKTGTWDALQQRTVVFKPTVNEVANDIKLGTVDAGIIWDALLAQYPELNAVPIRDLVSVQAQVAVGVLQRCPQPAAALHFARFLSARDRGLQQFKRLGYRVVEGDEWQAKPELVFYSGAMNRGAIEETIQHFEHREGVHVTRVYNGCGILVAQMKAGGRPDAYLTCDRSFLPPVADLFPGEPVEMSDSRIVLLAPKGNPKSLRVLKDLARPGLRLGVANPEQSTLGALTHRLLEQEGILAAVMTNVVTQTPTADMLVNQLSTGALDAVVVYVSNTTKVRDQLDVVPLPMPEALAVQTYSVGKNSKHRHLAERLLEALRSEASRARYESAGFHWRASTNGVP